MMTLLNTLKIWFCIQQKQIIKLIKIDHLNLSTQLPKLKKATVLNYQNNVIIIQQIYEEFT